MDERDHSSVSEPVGQKLKELGVVHRVDKFRRVEIHNPHIPLIDDLECLVDHGLTTSVRTKAVAVRAEYGVIFLTDLLSYRLLDDSIDCGWDSQRSLLAFLLLRDHDSTYELGRVLHGLHNLNGMRTKVVEQILNGHAVDARPSFVCLDLLSSCSVQ